jgi:MinD superfamily P-loop ATPase
LLHKHVRHKRKQHPQDLDFCKENTIEVVGVIPFSPEVTQAMVNEETVVEYAPESGVAQEIVNMWNKMSLFIGEEQP